MGKSSSAKMSRKPSNHQILVQEKSLQSMMVKKEKADEAKELNTMIDEICKELKANPEKVKRVHRSVFSKAFENIAPEIVEAFSAAHLHMKKLPQNLVFFDMMREVGAEVSKGMVRKMIKKDKKVHIKLAVYAFGVEELSPIGPFQKDVWLPQAIERMQRQGELLKHLKIPEDGVIEWEAEGHYHLIPADSSDPRASTEFPYVSIQCAWMVQELGQFRHMIGSDAKIQNNWSVGTARIRTKLMPSGLLAADLFKEHKEYEKYKEPMYELVSAKTAHAFPLKKRWFKYTGSKSLAALKAEPRMVVKAEVEAEESPEHKHDAKDEDDEDEAKAEQSTSEKGEDEDEESANDEQEDFDDDFVTPPPSHRQAVLQSKRAKLDE